MYLDLLPDVINRGVKVFVMEEGKIVAEAFGSTTVYAPGEEYREEIILSRELKQNVILKRGEEYWTNSPVGSTMQRPHPLDLKIFHYYYHPEDEPTK